MIWIIFNLTPCFFFFLVRRFVYACYTCAQRIDIADAQVFEIAATSEAGYISIGRHSHDFRFLHADGSCALRRRIWSFGRCAWHLNARTRRATPIQQI